MKEQRSEPSRIPNEAMAIVHQAALDEDHMRRLGARPERIKSEVHKAMSRQLAMLAARGVDVRAVLPPEKTDLKPSQELTAEEEAEVDRLDNMGIFNIAEAIQRAKNKQ